MPKVQDQLGRLRIAVPCQAGWEGMVGDERVRHWALCSLNVYNFAEMTRDEVRALLVRTEGRVCARLYRRADGTVITRDCPTGLRAIRRRASRVAAALIAALCSLPAFALGAGAGAKPRFTTHGSKVKLNVERVATPQLAVLTGVVLDESGDLLPGVTITVRDESATHKLTTASDEHGVFNIPSLNEGLYRIEVTLAGFQPATMEHLQIKNSEVTHARIALRLEGTTGIVVGSIADPMMMNEGVGVRFSQDFINKLPM